MAKKSAPDTVPGRIEAGLYILEAILAPEEGEAAPVTGSEGPTISFMIYWCWRWIQGKLGLGPKAPPSST